MGGVCEFNKKNRNDFLVDKWVGGVLLGLGAVGLLGEYIRGRAELRTAIRSIQADFDSLGYSERFVLRRLLEHRVLSEEQANQMLAGADLKTTNVLSGMKNHTPFVVPHYSGQFSINESLRRPLSSLLQQTR